MFFGCVSLVGRHKVVGAPNELSAQFVGGGVGFFTDKFNPSIEDGLGGSTFITVKVQDLKYTK